MDSTHTGYSPLGEVFFSLCKEIDTPVSLGAWLRFKYELSSVLDLTINPRDYLECDKRRFRDDFCVASYLSKYKGFTGIDKRAVALQKFATSERQCLETNKRLIASRTSPIDGELSARMFLAKGKIAKLLGPFSLEKVDPHFGWGPGATFDLRRRSAQIDRKLTTLPLTVGSGVRHLAEHQIRSDLHWSAAILGVYPDGPFSFTRECFEVVDSCRLTTVAKSSKTDRTIAVEPTLNLFIQKGAGGYIRRRLSKVGIDLDDQTRNQSLAQKGLADSLATLDLSAASDTVSTELIYELLPVDWANFLAAARSRFYMGSDGVPVRLEKFSSMGNGFTFELETLIFWALTHVSCSPQATVSVYGDDIICPCEDYDEVVRTLNFCGFTVNETKSFKDGLYRESCGEHYFSDLNVTPVYQKQVVEEIFEAHRQHNRLYRWFSGDSNACKSVRRNFPSKHLLPEGLEGDSGYLIPLHEFMATRPRVCRNRGYHIHDYGVTTLSLPGIERALLAFALRRDSKNLAPNDLKPSYGDVEVPSSRLITTDRWVIPPGVCPLI